jgi:putative (di)nucleoside polyphosphate hydrolase
MLIGADRRIFVGRRRGMSAGTGWQMPQGGVDKGETPIEAACRELREEVGTNKALLLRESRQWITYDLPANSRPSHWRGRWRGQAQKWFALAFTGHDGDIDVAAHDDGQGPEFDAWKWVTAPQMLEEIVSFKRDVYQVVVEEFADLLA